MATSATPVQIVNPTTGVPHVPPTTDASGNVSTISAALPATTDRSGSITLGGTAQNVAAANASRRGLTFQNTSDTEMRVTENGVAATATTGFIVPTNSTLHIRSNKLISVFCATTGKTFAATEW